MGGKHTKLQAQDVLSRLSGDIVSGPIAGNVDRNPKIHSDLSGFLTRADQNNFGLTSKNFFSHLNEERSRRITSALLLSVARGQQDKAERLLKKSPEWIVARGEVTDYSGRTFKNITAFEYALWAKDTYMINMMLDCILDTAEGQDLIRALQASYDVVTNPVEQGGGVSYERYEKRTMPDGSIKDVLIQVSENHFSFQSVIDAYADYLTLFNHLALLRLWYQQCRAWVECIGGQQLLFPAHVAQHFCDPDVSFYPNPPSFKGSFKRSLMIHDGIWYACKSFEFGWTNRGLSTHFAIARGSEQHHAIARQLAHGEAQIDLAALVVLNAVRTREVENDIKQRLSSALSHPPRLVSNRLSALRGES